MAEAAGKRLIEANLQLVVVLAEHYQNERTHILDLIQKGNEVLLRAVQLNRLPPGSSPLTPAHWSNMPSSRLLTRVQKTRRAAARRALPCLGLVIRRYHHKMVRYAVLEQTATVMTGELGYTDACSVRLNGHGSR